MRFVRSVGTFLATWPLEVSALTGVVLVGVGVGIHDIGAGLAATGGLLVGLSVFSSLLLKAR